MWPGKRANIRKMCKECHLCAVAKDYGRSGRQPLEPNKVDYLEPLQKVDLGLVGPLPKAKRWLTAFDCSAILLFKISGSGMLKEWRGFSVNQVAMRQRFDSLRSARRNDNGLQNTTFFSGV